MYDQLSTLPVELIHKILDYVPTFDILTSVWLINKRLRTVSLAYPRFRLELTCSFDKKKIFYQLCTQLVNISSQVVSLALYDLEDETIPDKISYFFGRSNTFNSTFSHLQSLHLSHVNYNVWDSIKTQLVSLVALTATSTNYGIYEEPQTPSFASVILMDLFNFSPSLKRLSLATIDYPYPIATIDPSRTLTASSLEYVDLSCIEIDLKSLFSITPALHSFTSTVDYNILISNIHEHPSVNLQRLSITFDGVTFKIIECLLSSMNCLAHFTLVAEKEYPMVSLQRLQHLKLAFSYSNEDELNIVNRFSSFVSLTSLHVDLNGTGLQTDLQERFNRDSFLSTLPFTATIVCIWI
ncbi:unnamed protein product [Rotaria socialis]